MPAFARHQADDAETPPPPAEAPKRGRLTVVHGPMFAGKSTAILDRMGRATAEGRPALVLKPAMDTRYSETHVVNHDGRSVAATAISAWPVLQIGVQEVFLDECQFLVEPWYRGDIVEDVEKVLGRGIDVTACGLDHDWRRDPFGVTSRLLLLADEAVHRLARCVVCDGPARWTARKAGSGAVVELGSGDKYEPRCDDHWSLPR